MTDDKEKEQRMNDYSRGYQDGLQDRPFDLLYSGNRSYENGYEVGESRRREYKRDSTMRDYLAGE
jgi:hypothetical protein